MDACRAHQAVGLALQHFGIGGVVHVGKQCLHALKPRRKASDETGFQCSQFGRGWVHAEQRVKTIWSRQR